MLTQERAQSAALELSARFAQAPDEAAPDQAQNWSSHPLPVSSQLLDYVPGRDAMISAPEMAAGLDAFDASSGEHVLWAAALPTAALDLARPFVLRWVASPSHGPGEHSPFLFLWVVTFC